MIKKAFFLIYFLLLLVVTTAFATTKIYTLKTSGTIDTNKSYLIVYQTSTSATSGLMLNSNLSGNTATPTGSSTAVQGASAVSVDINSNNQISTDDSNAYTFTSTGESGKYYIMSSTGYYIGNTSTGSQYWFSVSKSTGTSYVNTVSFSGNNIQIKGSTQNNGNDYYLQYDPNQGIFFYCNDKSLPYLYEETTVYNVTCSTVTGGTISATPTSASKGTTITLSNTPDDGYTFGSYTVTNASGLEIAVSTNNTFTMPASDVTVSGTFKVNSTVTRDVTAGTYQSFCLPFDIKMSALSQYFDKVYRISGNYVFDLPNCHDIIPEGDNSDDIGAKSMSLARRKVASDVEESTDLDDYALSETPFALYINTDKSPNTFHVFCEEMPDTDEDGEDIVLEADVPFYALVKDGVTSVTLSPESGAEVSTPNTQDNLLTIYNYVAGSSTTTQLSDVGTTEGVAEDNTVYAYNENGTFTKAESNDVTAYHGFLLSDASDLNIVVHYGEYGDRVEMAKSATIGDANRDGDVDIVDVTSVISYNLDNSQTIDKEAADADDNGKVETADVVTIANTVLEK